MRFTISTVFALAAQLAGAQYCYGGGQLGYPPDLERASEIACSTMLSGHYTTGDHKYACVNGFDMPDTPSHYNWLFDVDFEGLTPNHDPRQIDLDIDHCKDIILDTFSDCGDNHGGQSIHDDFYIKIIHQLQGNVKVTMQSYYDPRDSPRYIRPVDTRHIAERYSTGRIHRDAYGEPVKPPEVIATKYSRDRERRSSDYERSHRSRRGSESRDHGYEKSSRYYESRDEYQPYPKHSSRDDRAESSRAKPSHKKQHTSEKSSREHSHHKSSRHRDERDPPRERRSEKFRDVPSKSHEEGCSRHRESSGYSHHESRESGRHYNRDHDFSRSRRRSPSRYNPVPEYEEPDDDDDDSVMDFLVSKTQKLLKEKFGSWYVYRANSGAEELPLKCPAQPKGGGRRKLSSKLSKDKGAPQDTAKVPAGRAKQTVISSPIQSPSIPISGWGEIDLTAHRNDIRPRFHIDAKPYDDLVSTVYNHIQSHHASGPKYIPYALFRYYCYLVWWCKIIWLRKANGNALNTEEMAFLDVIASEPDIQIPSAIAQYLANVGNFQQGGDTYYFERQEVAIVDSDLPGLQIKSGWFQTTHAQNGMMAILGGCILNSPRPASFAPDVQTQFMASPSTVTWMSERLSTIKGCKLFSVKQLTLSSLGTPFQAYVLSHDDVKSTAWDYLNRGILERNQFNGSRYGKLAIKSRYAIDSKVLTPAFSFGYRFQCSECWVGYDAARMPTYRSLSKHQPFIYVKADDEAICDVDDAWFITMNQNFDIAQGLLNCYRFSTRGLDRSKVLDSALI
ncbi:hypothetical protein GGR57DRAFT_501633 [Xylariaceae sp. FL1272]|nr:hypothetical protein GGR57DRAFT_501633 [Xylariaceae sp. FL1272]